MDEVIKAISFMLSGEEAKYLEESHFPKRNEILNKCNGWLYIE